MAHIAPLTALRGIAASCVLLHHMVYWLTPNLGPWLEGYTAFFSKGYLWVDFFFILSGFLLTLLYGSHFSTASRLAKNTYDYRTYLQARFARIYPVHLFIISLFLLLECYRWWKGDTVFIGSRNWVDLVKNLFLLQAVQLSPVLTTWNGPAWSISAEWIMYMLLPLGMLALHRLGFILRIAYIPVSILLLWVISTVTKYQLDLTGYLGILRCILEALLGSTLAITFYNKPLLGPRSYNIFFLVFFLGTLVCLHWGSPDILCVVFMAALVLFSSSRHGLPNKLLSTPALVFLGKISYSLYMVHWFAFIVIRIISDKVFEMDLLSNNPREILNIYGISLACIMVTSVLLYYFIEQPCRDWLRKFN